MRIFFSVGEPSGDIHGANLVRELRQSNRDVECVGYGGPKMRAAGCELHEDLTTYAVMWFARVLLNLHHFWRFYRSAEAYFRAQRPDAVVLIDYPGFNWWIARAAKRHDIPVFYYGVPQIWAWAPWRIKKMRRLVDHALCKLPFEASWYGERGCPATYVGHPFFDETNNHQLDREFVAQQAKQPNRLVTILPGSRTQEVTSNLRWFIKAAELVHQNCPNTRFAIASFNEKQAKLARQIVANRSLPVEIHIGKTPELIHLATCCMACSGSVSLELLHHHKPTVILYWVSGLAYFVQKRFRTVKYITLVNLLAADDLFPKHITPYDPNAPGADQIPFPEYVTCGDESKRIAGHITEWLTDREKLESRVTILKDLAEQHGRPGASTRAAEYILATLIGNKPTIAAPHFASGASSPRKRLPR
ncbi:MAG: lipid-A-disaccharide synthase [Planctomycetaceae bacterium]|nr:lipid-A-disaccharide synthase [Planctomycetales bacterium]MCB9920840.1 lipid-A-disaccharide synthase [Planctomycetaceae bacterium]